MFKLNNLNSNNNIRQQDSGANAYLSKGFVGTAMNRSHIPNTNNLHYKTMMNAYSMNVPKAHKTGSFGESIAKQTPPLITKVGNREWAIV